MEAAPRNYPFLLATVQAMPTRLEALALVPAEVGLKLLSAAAEKRLAETVFVWPDSGKPGTILRDVTRPYAIELLATVKWQRVRLAESLGDVQPDEVGHLWEQPDGAGAPMGPGWGIIPRLCPVTIRARDAPPEPLEVTVVG